MADKTIGPRLTEDKWLVLNTLPLILEHLETLDMLRCSRVCKLWNEVIEDPVCWRTVQFTNRPTYFSICGLLSTLRKRKTIHLKIKNGFCSSRIRGIFDMLPQNEPNEDMKSLKSVEIIQCPSMLCETVLNGAVELESIKIDLIAGSLLNLIKADLIFKMSHLRELRIRHSTKIDGFELILSHLHNLRVLYLLNTSDIFLNAHLDGMHTNRLEVLALGNVGYMPDHAILSLLKASPSLKRLRLESGTHWDPKIFFDAIGKMGKLTCLELLDFKIVDGFELGMEFSKNIENLTIMPSLHRFYIPMFNTRILTGVLQHLRETLKTFTFGFSREYLLTVGKIADRANVIPLHLPSVDTAKRDPFFKYSALLPITQVEEELIELMPGIEVKVGELDSLGNIFK